MFFFIIFCFIILVVVLLFFAFLLLLHMWETTTVVWIFIVKILYATTRVGFPSYMYKYKLSTLDYAAS